MKQIHDSLQRVFERNRLVFWYDPTGEWAEVANTYPDESVIRLKVAGNELGTKVQVVRVPKPDTKFLLYIPTARPADTENWLLDLLLQGYEFKADKASLALAEAGLAREFRHLAEEHAAFFGSAKRIKALRDLISKDDQDRDIRLKMMAVLAGTPVELDALLLHFLVRGEQDTLVDPVEEAFGPARLAEPFWRLVGLSFGYASETPSLRDFAVLLFRGANPLDTQVALHPHARVFLQRWKDSQAHCESYREWSRQLERELQVGTALESRDDPFLLGESDTFEIFEKFTLHRLCQAFEQGVAAADLRTGIQERRNSFWRREHEDGYAALEHAVDLRELLASAELTVDSVATGVSRYLATWWRIDLAYRRFNLHLRRYGQVQLMERIHQWVEKAYVNNYLLPLADCWSDRVRELPTWECPGVTAQRRFFDTFVQPFKARGQKVFVIVSDALRYEAAAEFAQRLASANRWTAEIEVMFGSLPSYTQLGMASLLPGRQREVDAATGSVTLDGRSATGTDNRAEILRASNGATATAVQAEEFLELNSKTEGRALSREHDIIYIFHNHIDKVGDAAVTEGKTFDAVEHAFDELDQIIRKVANINGTHMLLTADHGFLFQQDAVVSGDMAALPDAQEWTYRARRFALGRGISSGPGVKVFSAEELGLGGDWSAVFPLSLGRFPLQGSGKRYVHGGISLQEVLVPVVRIHKARSDDTSRVEVDLLRVPNKITTGHLSIALFQVQAAVDKVLPRTLRIGVFAKDGTPLSEIKTQVFDSTEIEARQRETTLVLTLSNAADAFNNREVEIRLEETVQGTSQTVTYKTHSVKLQKPFANDFDDF